MGKSRTKFFVEARDEGCKVPGDCGTPIDQQPEWFDETKMLEAARVFRDYSSAILLSHLLGTIIMSQVSSLLDVLSMTGNHDTLAAAVKRAVMTTYHVREWYEGRIQDHEGPARRVVKLVRNMHTKASKITSEQRPKTDGEVWLSQYDMALTQFAFIGALVINPQKLGFFGTEAEIESILYYWRYIGYLLGMEDKYNLCGAGTYHEVRATCLDIAEEVAKPKLADPQPNYTRTIEYAFVGFGKLGAAVYYPSFFNFTCDLLDCPELKKRLTLKEFLAYWFFTISTSLMAYPGFRKRANAEHRRKSGIKIRRIVADLKKGDLVVSETSENTSNAIWKIFQYIQTIFVSAFEKLRKLHGE